MKLHKFQNLFSKIMVSFDLINEVDQDVIDRIPELDSDNMDYIFGDKVRLSEKLSGGSKFKVPIEKFLDGYDIDYNTFVAFKKSDMDKKNPTKIGKVLAKQKKQLEKNGGDAKDIKELDELLKITDLKKVVNTEEASLYVIYSRSPIDVVRMGDTTRHSCHSPDGEYFYCALADAQNNAGIAYLITETEFGNIKNLQAEEIFLDTDRGVEGIKPLARIRLRKVVDDDMEQQVIPSLNVYAGTYGNFEYDKVFKDQVAKWSKSKLNSKFNWEGVLSLKGGSYEDSSVDVETMAKSIFNKDIEYYHDDSDEEEFKGEFEESEEEEFERLEEHAFDGFKEDLETKISDFVSENFKLDRIYINRNTCEYTIKTHEVIAIPSDSHINWDANGYVTIDDSFDTHELYELDDVYGEWYKEEKLENLYDHLHIPSYETGEEFIKEMREYLSHEYPKDDMMFYRDDIESMNESYDDLIQPLSKKTTENISESDLNEITSKIQKELIEKLPRATFDVIMSSDDVEDDEYEYDKFKVIFNDLQVKGIHHREQSVVRVDILNSGGDLFFARDPEVVNTLVDHMDALYELDESDFDVNEFIEGIMDKHIGN